MTRAQHHNSVYHGIITCGGADSLKLCFHVFFQKHIQKLWSSQTRKAKRSPKGTPKGPPMGSKRASTCLHGKQVCDAVEVGKAGGAKQIEQEGLTSLYMSQLD